jgi:aspartyl-tRNA(Asn)/glutamyl-tRNA(Gln) amidotransferase subunit A
MRGIFEQGAGVDAATYAASWEDQARLIAEFEDALAGYDALVLPANPRPALRWGEWEGLNVFQWYRFTWPFNVTGQPAVTVPCALSPEGLPIAYQLVGRRGEDEHLIRVARWAIRERRFEAQAPPLSGPNSDLP